MAARTPQAVLFACGLNSVRSPMAESLLQQMFPQALYVKSAGVRKGELDPFAVAVMAELGQDISRPQADDLRGTRRLGRAQFRPDHHAVAGGASQGAGTDAHASPPTSNTGRPTIRPAPKAAASRSCRPIARSATACCCASASALPRAARRAGSPVRDVCSLRSAASDRHAVFGQLRSQARVPRLSNPKPSDRFRAHSAPSLRSNNPAC